MHSRLTRLAIGLAAILCASPAVAENWVKLGTSDGGDVWSVDKDSIDRDHNDGLVYFTDEDSSSNGVDTSDEAVDCQIRLQYTLKINADYITGWRDEGHAIAADSAMDAVMKYVCANAG